MKTESRRAIINVLAVLSVFVFSMLMLNTIRQYMSWRTDVGFLQFKQAVIHNPYWLFFFYVHIFSVVLCLLAGGTQFSGQLLRERPRLHRILGRIYVYNILLVNVPACFVLAVFSNGGLLGITGFVLQDLLWAFFTIAGIVAVKCNRITAHQRYMAGSYAITTTAITFRIFKQLFYEWSTLPYQLFYGLNVWVALLFNLLVALLIIYIRNGKLSLQRYRIDQDKNSNSHQHKKR